jgi:hypothetical protein
MEKEISRIQDAVQAGDLRICTPPVPVQSPRRGNARRRKEVVDSSQRSRCSANPSGMSQSLCTIFYYHSAGPQHLADKIYSVRVNSMAEERTVSAFTWITPALRSNLQVNTMVAMTQIGQYYQTKQKVQIIASHTIVSLTTRTGARKVKSVSYSQILRHQKACVPSLGFRT